MNNFFDVSKGNNIILFIISLPFIILAWILFLLFYVVVVIACVIGRRKALNLIYKTKEMM